MELIINQEFLARYRFSKAAVLELLSMLLLQQNTDRRGCPVLPLLQLLVRLHLYDAGTFQVVSGDLVHVSQPPVYSAVMWVSTTIASTLFPALFKFPDAGKMHEVMHQFYTKAKFPRVTGSIIAGRDDVEVFRNRMGYFSFNLQVSGICT